MTYSDLLNKTQFSFARELHQLLIANIGQSARSTVWLLDRKPQGYPFKITTEARILNSITHD